MDCSGCFPEVNDLSFPIPHLDAKPFHYAKTSILTTCQPRLARRSNFTAPIILLMLGFPQGFIQIGVNRSIMRKVDRFDATLHSKVGLPQQVLQSLHLSSSSAERHGTNLLRSDQDMLWVGLIRSLMWKRPANLGIAPDSPFGRDSTGERSLEFLPFGNSLPCPNSTGADSDEWKVKAKG